MWTVFGFMFTLFATTGNIIRNSEIEKAKQSTILLNAKIEYIKSLFFLRFTNDVPFISRENGFDNNNKKSKTKQKKDSFLIEWSLNSHSVEFLESEQVYFYVTISDELTICTWMRLWLKLLSKPNAFSYPYIANHQTVF